VAVDEEPNASARHFGWYCITCSPADVLGPDFCLVQRVPATVRCHSTRSFPHCAKQISKTGMRQYDPAKGISRDIGLLSNKQAILTQKNKVSMAFAYLRGTHPSRDVPICWAGIDL